MGDRVLPGIEETCLDVHPTMFRTLHLSGWQQDWSSGHDILSLWKRSPSWCDCNLWGKFDLFHVLGVSWPVWIGQPAPTTSSCSGKLWTSTWDPCMSRTLIVPAFFWPAFSNRHRHCRSYIKCTCGSNHHARGKGCLFSGAHQRMLYQPTSAASSWCWKPRAGFHMSTSLQGFNLSFRQGSCWWSLFQWCGGAGDQVTQRNVEGGVQRQDSSLNWKPLSATLPTPLTQSPLPCKWLGQKTCTRHQLFGHTNRVALVSPVKARNTKEHIQMIKVVEMAFHSLTCSCAGTGARRRRRRQSAWVTSSSLPSSVMRWKLAAPP